MNKREYGEFHKFLALLYYDYIYANNNATLSEECRKSNEEMIEAIQKVMIAITIEEKK